jgi:cell division protein ZapE
MPEGRGVVVPILSRDEPVDPARLIAGFRPPPRFAEVSFENYFPDPAYPSQAQAKERLQAASNPEAERRGLFSLLRRRDETPSGIYLDGGFGVGKTHLLASTYFAASGRKAFLSFQELVFTIGALGMDDALEAFTGLRLLAVDEFELDDPGNTLMVATFLDRFMPSGVRVVTTSNTLPEQLGEGRFNADDFKREIHGIAARFTTVRLDGPDYRHREGLATPAPLARDALVTSFEVCNERKALVGFDGLNEHLARLHPIRFAGLLDGLDVLFLEGLEPIAKQDVALRFVHLIDKLYDRHVALVASGCPMSDLFPSEYRNGGYRKKYSRCLSRLGELLRESERYARDPTMPRAVPSPSNSG